LARVEGSASGGLGCFGVAVGLTTVAAARRTALAERPGGWASVVCCSHRVGGGPLARADTAAEEFAAGEKLELQFGTGVIVYVVHVFEDQAGPQVVTDAVEAV